MEFLAQAFWAPLTETYFQKALIGGCMVAVVSGVVGCLVVLRRMAFLGDALSHAMIAGIAGGYLVMKLLFGLEAHAPGMLLGSLLAAVLTVALIGLVARISRIKEDTAIGIMYTGVFALGVVVVSIFRGYIHIDLMHFILGDILGVADTDLWASAGVAALVLSILILFFRQFQLATFDPVMAASIGLPVLLLDYALTTCVSLVVVSAVSMVGVILVVGLLITPAATAYLLCDRLDRMMVLAALFGISSVVGGLYLCVWLDSAGGGAVMLFCTLQFLVVLAVAPRYGLLARWLRRRRLVPQQVVEDVLTTILRNKGETPLPVIRQYVQHPANLSKTLRQMEQNGLISAAGGGYRLTEAGEKEARQVLRAHRLWETYLESIGTPKEALHPTAHRMEHIRAEGTVDYLDEKLGRPAWDPHGKKIPPRQENGNQK
jgi:manganese/iron transport system permease protein/iron/zinc/copper transport system permease protein